MRGSIVALLGVALSCLAMSCAGDDAHQGAHDLEPADPPYVPPPEACAGASLDTPQMFAPCNVGGGVFGTWVTDDLGLPAYDYGLDQNADERARYETTDGREHRDHWAAFGNERLTALFSNDGYVEVVTQDRGVTYLNKYIEDDEGRPTARAGAYSFVDDGERTWTTAYKWRPRGSLTTRRFGMGYAEATMLHRDVFVQRRTIAPQGDVSFLVDEVKIENRGSAPKTLRHYEHWDVARRPIEINWIVSGRPLSAAPRTAATGRDARNGLFNEAMQWDSANGTLMLRRSHASGQPPPREEANATDYYPGDPFLAVLGGEVSDIYTDDARFFGEGGGIDAPRVVRERAAGELAGGPDAASRSGADQPRMFVVRSDLTLAPGESKTLRFAYGYAAMGAPLQIDAQYKDPSNDVRRAHADALKKHLLYFASPTRDPYLHRELAWHAAQVEESVGYREYWGRKVVPQGSAYLYLHGADGATRDTALFALPLVYTHPELAKQQLSLAMGLAFAEDSRFSYAFQGHGMLDDALGLHSQPSDLDLFFLLAIAEYLGATGDLAFLDEKISYYPQSAANEATVRDHITRSIRHLLHAVGFGEHGLLRVGTGDWSDGIVAMSANREQAIAKGESIPNSQMALAVLPRVLPLIEGDAALATEVRAAIEKLKAAVETTWTGEHYGRVYYGDGVLHGVGGVDLEAQVWPLLSRDPSDHRGPLLSKIARELDDPSPVGAPLTKEGQVWPAIAQLLTWGYANSGDADRAWSHLAKMSLVARARAYPDVWLHIWSGPDGASSKSGAAWMSAVTPMTDFPTMNNNVHAMAMLAALRVAGIEAESTQGMRIRLAHASGDLAVRTSLIDLTITANGTHYIGAYRPHPGVERTITFVVPAGKQLRSLTVQGNPVSIEQRTVSVTRTADQAAITFEVDIEP